MIDDVGTELAALGDTMTAGFARIDRFIELPQARHLDLHEVRSLRDWATREFAEVRGELRHLRREVAGGDAALRRDVEALGARVDRLEQRLEQRTE